MEAREPAVQGPMGSVAVAGGTATAATQTHIPCIAGVYVEASSKTLSLSDASREHLLQPDLALVLLEAQAATGGIVDPIRKQLVSVAEALGMGLAGLEMKERLLCAERAVTGFTDPYTEEKISLYQAIQKELIGREEGLHLLEAQIATGGIIEPTTGRRLPLEEACAHGYLDEDLSNILSDPGNEEFKGFLDPNSNQKVTYFELMRRCIASPSTGLLLLPLKISFPGLRGTVCSHELLDSGILDSTTFKALHDGKVTAQEVAEMDAIQQYLSGINSIAGVAILQTGESRSLYQALSEHFLMPGTAEILLQAQAATGGLIDPIKNKSFAADEAVQAGVVGPELYEKLSSAEKAMTGYKDPYTGETLSLFQAMKKGLVPRDPGIFLLEAQLATGGIIDPHTHHRLPLEVACQRGHLDKDTHSLLCNPTNDTRGFFEPNSKQNMSYAELLSRCVADPDTGLCLLPLSSNPGKEHPFIDQRTQCVLKSTMVPKPCGHLRGCPVSLWKLLFSDYLTREQRRALTQQFCSGSLSTQALADRVIGMVQQVSANSRVTFEGLRDKVTPAQLLSSEIISKDLFEKLTHGETLAKEVLGVGTVRRYLEGTGSIAGLLLPDSQEKISIYRAKRRGLLRPGTSLILLEAQAATGYIIDPVANQKYTVDEALRAKVIGPDVYDKLLAAEKAVTGFRDPYTGSKISLFQAMMKDLIVREHAIRLLEAQIATGGIIDPVNSLRLPVEAAYKRGYFDKKLNLILSDPSDDTKGFFDPNTQENLTYLQLKEKCLTEPSTGLCLLPLNSRRRPLIDDTTRQAFQHSWLLVRYGRFQGQRVSVWNLLNSEYFSEGKRREILNHYSLRKVTLEQIRLLLEEEMKKWARIQFPAIRGSVTAHHLLETGIIDRDLFEKLLEGTVSPEEALSMDSVRKYLYGTGSIGGIVLRPSHERVSLYEAMKRNMVLPGVALPLLEAQAATGFIIDPVNNQKLCLDEAVREGVIGPELYEKLHRAEEAVTGYQDPFTGKKISLFQAMKKGLVADKQAMQLMDAQLSTGGVMDPHSGHYVPVEFAQKKGYLDEDFHKALSNPSSDTKAFSTLDWKEKVTYGQLIHQCERDEASGIHLLPLSEAASPISTDEQIEQQFRETLLEDRGISLWELLSSGYFTEEQRSEFLEKFRSKAISLEQLVSHVQGLVEDIEIKAQTQVTFQGLRGEVPAVWLLDTGIISEETFAELAQGRRTAREVSEMESVKKYLSGTGSIAGVFIQDAKEKMGIYQAMQNGFLLPGTGTRLLEAQAATGSIIDPVTNQKLGVEDAIKAGLVGEEFMGQLLQAERAITGYPDPYSGKPISVCQAIRKELIPSHVGIPLLEAQLATGGIVDPVHHHHLPLQAAYRLGFYDEDMHKALSQLNDETCIFFDPNTQESLTYQQLKDRCLRDPATGLLLLPLSKDAAFYGDRHTMDALKSITVCVNVGRFRGQEVSLWDLLNSEYITQSKRRELVLIYKEKKAEALQEMIAAITQIMEETEQQGQKFAFKGLRKQVSASDLFQSQLIDKRTLDDLRQGRKTVQEVTQMDSVRQYLEGSNFIAGVLLQPSRERMSIYQAMRQGLLRPGAALVLLEAQAATGFLIDPVGNKRLSVDEAVAMGLIGRETYGKLLSAEKAVTGYTHPYTRRKISLFEAMKEELIVKSHGIRLLEAQVATGGIIDPVHSHRIPVEVAYKRGYFDEKLNQILLDPTDDTKGFFDPNTHENLTYLQLLERCVQDPETGLYMLQIVKRGGRYFYIDEATKQFLKAQPMQMHVGRYKGQAVSMWDLLCSPYIHEQKRKDLVSQYKGGSMTLEQLGKAIYTVVEETEQKAQAFQLKGPVGKVSAADLFNSEIIDKKTLDGLHRGPDVLQQLVQKDSVRRFLEGTGCIAGILAKGQKMTVCEAMERGLLSPKNGLMLLEAQAATGLFTDPMKKKTFSVDQAVSARLVGKDVQTKLHLAEKAMTGYTDPTTGNKVSLYQAMKKNIIEKGLALRLLEAQIATGGIMDPFYGHRIPVEVAYKRGHLDDGTFLWLSDAEYANKGFVDPNTQERVTYAQLLERCVKDADSGMYLLPLLDKTEYFYVDEVTKNILSSTKVNVTLGKFRGQTISLWELLSSDYINEEKKKELIQKYKQGPSEVLQHITNEILNMVKEKEQTRREVWFQGLRKQVTASELLKADIISQDTMENLEEGKQTAKEVARMDSVKRYLEGTSCIAGVLVPARSDPAKTEKMTIYQAMWKGILRPGTALVLLEAQAATGFLLDPLKNAKLSVSEAISVGLVGGEIQNKLLSAEKAVTGYTDPNTGGKISLFQAMKKGLILKEHGIRLLEAQIATGGIIDPMHSHRVPVEVAYKRGCFDEEMNQILTDPTDDTKGFFDPNTHENLTYMQLLQRCTCDTDTGLLMLQIQDQQLNAHSSDERIRQALQSVTINIDVGNWQGNTVSAWDLLLSRYIPETKRKELLNQYGVGGITVQEMITTLKSTIYETEEHIHKPEKKLENPRTSNEKTSQTQDNIEHKNEEKQQELKTKRINIYPEKAQSEQPSIWNLLFSDYIAGEKRTELLDLYCRGLLPIEWLITVLTTLVQKNQATTRKMEVKAKSRDPELGGRERDPGLFSPNEGNWESTLRAQRIQVSLPEFQDQQLSVWDVLFSQHISERQREEFLSKYRTGNVTLEELIDILAALLAEGVTRGRRHPTGPDAGIPGHGSPVRADQEGDGNQEEKEETVTLGEKQEEALKSRMVNIGAGEFHSKSCSLWELLFSKYVTAEKRHELLDKHLAGNVSTEQLVQLVVTLIEEMEEKSHQLKFSGLRRQVTASELFNAQIIDQDTLSKLTQGTKTVEEITEMDSVKRYLEGTSCIAGVLVPARSDPAKTEKMTIYQAMWKGILRPGTALVLLEAQAATGFIIDPLQNRKLSVDEAVAAEVVGAELREKLLSAERAVTGYKDPYTGSNLSLFQAMKKGLIVKDHGIRLLEAQIATGGIIDPVHSHRLPVEVAYRRGFFDEEMNKTLSDPSDDTKGFFDPNTHENLTYKQLLNRCLPDPHTGLLMLHVMEKGSSSFLLNENTRKALQSATVRMDVGLFQGQAVSLWDLLFSRYIPPQRREELLRQYKTGTLTLQALTQSLTATVLETEERSTEQSGQQEAPATHGAKPPGAATDRAHREETVEEALRSRTVSMPTGEHQGHPVVVWDLLFSDYIAEEKRTELLDLYRRGLLPMERLISVLTTLVQKKQATTRKLEVKAKSRDPELGGRERDPGLFSPNEGNWESTLRAQRIQVSLPEFQDQQLSVWDVLFSQHISERQREELLSKYRTGNVTLEKLIDILAALLAEGVTRGRRHPTGPDAGSPGHGSPVRADQEGDGSQEEEAETVTLGEKQEEALKSRMVKVAAGEFHGQRVSVWDLLHSKHIPKGKKKELLQLYKSGILTTDQMETVVTTIVNETEKEKAKEATHAQVGCWEDPLRNHTVVLHVGQFQGQEVSLWDLLFSQYVPEAQREEFLMKYRSGTLSLQEMIGALAPLLSEGGGSSGKGAEGASSPPGEGTGPLGGGPSISATDSQLETALRQVQVEVSVGEFQGKSCSLWELLFSKYVTAEKRHELLDKHLAGNVSTEQLVQLVVTLIEEMEEKSHQLKFSGLRRQVTASELFNAQIIDQDTLSKLTQGTKTVEEITEMDSVKRYLEGTSCIAGVLVPARSDPAKTEKMTIYQAMWKGILRPGTALVLLEAQAATGFITDPLQNRKLSVNEAVAAEVVGAELREKLLSAERAVTGYKDPYTGSNLSLFQAMKKGLIVKDHGIRLLEAQIATGGIIDPVHSHRLPVEVAYRRGFFDEEMNKTLSDPSDDTKGFFDPNTHENLTYKQLLNRCLPDPHTGLLMLHVMEKGSSSFLLNENTRKALQSATVRMDVGLFQGQAVSLWDLLFSRYIPPQRREELLRQYKTGTLTLQALTQSLTATVLETEERSTEQSGQQEAPDTHGAKPPGAATDRAHREETVEEALRSRTVSMPTGEHQGHPVVVWDLLFSDYIAEEKRTELLDLYRRGLLPMERLISVLTTLVQKKQATTRKLEVKAKSRDPELGGRERDPGLFSPNEGNWESTLRAQRIQVSLPEFQDQQLSVWDVLFSQHISERQREELLSKYRTGNVTLEKLIDILAALLAEGVTRGRRHPTGPDAGSPGHGSPVRADQEGDGSQEEEAETVTLGEKQEEALKSRMVKVAAGEFHGQRVSVWDLLHSKHIPKGKKKELLQLYKSGILTTDQMETVVTTIVNETEKEKAKEATHAQVGCWEDPLRNHTVVLHVGQFQGQEVSLWDLLFSQYVPEAQREEFLMKYRSGTLSLQEMIGALAPLLSEGGGSSGKGAEGASSPPGEGTGPLGGGPSISATDSQLETALRQVQVEVSVGEFQGKSCSLWELLFSKYVTAEKRHELLDKHLAGNVSTEQLVQLVVTLIEEMEEKSHQLKFSGLRRQVTASELFNAQIIDQDTLSKLTQGTKTVEEITEMDSVKRYLEGTSCIAGVLVPARSDPAKTEKMTIYQAMWKGILRPGTALVLLEAQAATGFITDPLQNRKLSVNEAVAAEVVGAELREKLLSAERAVTGYKDPYTGSNLSLFQAMKKGLIVKDHGIRLLEAQIATGGIIDPVHSHRLPVEVAYRRGFFDEEMNKTLSDPSDDTKGFFDPNTHENLTYKQLLNRCLPDPHTGLLMLHVMEKGSSSFLLNENTRKALQSATVRMDVGLFQGQAVSLWDLLFSRYIPPQRREELLRQYKTGTLTLQALTQSLTATVLETEERSTEQSGQQEAPDTHGAKPPGAATDRAHREETVEEALRSRTVSMPTGEHQGHPVVVWDLLFSDYIAEEKRTELLDLYRRGLLPMERLISVLTTLVQKKQATTRKLEVKAKSRDPELGGRERDPGLFSPNEGNWESTLRAQRIQVSLPEFQDQQLSVWDVLFSQHISERQREELLSKYRTGNVTLEKLIDILAALLAEGVTRGRRHPTGPDAGSPGHGSPVRADQEGDGSQEEEAETVTLGEKQEEALKSRMVKVAAGEFHGQRVSVWDLLHSKHIPKGKKKELLQLYRSGILTTDQMETVVTTIVNETEKEKAKEATHAQVGCWEDPLHNHTVVLHVGQFQGQEVSLWDLLFSQYISENKREELLCIFRDCHLTPEELTAIISTLITEMEDCSNKHSALNITCSSVSSAEEGEEFAISEFRRNEIPPKSQRAGLPLGKQPRSDVSVLDLLHSTHIPEEKRQELLHLYESGSLTLDEMETLVMSLSGNKAKEEMEPVRCDVLEPGEAEVPPSSHYDLLQRTLGREKIDVTIREIQGARASVWDPFFSRCVAHINKEEILLRHGSPTVSVKENFTSITTLITETESSCYGSGSTGELPREDPRSAETFAACWTEQPLERENALKSRRVETSGTGFFTQLDSLWDLLHSHYIPEEKREELLHLFKSGKLTLDQMETEIIAIINQSLNKETNQASHEDLSQGHGEESLQHLTLMVRGQEVSLWNLLFSQDISECQREELWAKYKSGRLTLEELRSILATLLVEATTTQSHHMATTGISRGDDDENASGKDKERETVVLGEKPEEALKSRMVNVAAGKFHGQRVSVWDLLHSKYIPKGKRKELLRLYRSGILTTDQMETVVTTIVNKMEEEKAKEASHAQAGHWEGTTTPHTGIPKKDTSVRAEQEGDGDDDDDEEEEKEAEEQEEEAVVLGEKQEEALKSRMVNVATGKFHGQRVSVWDLLHSKYIPKGKRKELLRLYRSGILTTDQMETVVTTIVNKMEEEKAKEASHAQAGHWEGTTTPHTGIPKKDTSVRAEQEGDGDDDDDEEEEKEAEEQEEEAVVLGEKQEEALKSRMVNVATGKFHGQRVSVWDLLHSKYIPKGKRKELLRLYRSGILTTDQMETVVTTIVNKMEEEKAKEASHAQAGHWEGTTTPHTGIPKKDTSVRAEQEGDGDDDDDEEEEKEAEEQEEEAVVLGEKQEEALKSRMVNVATGKFHGQRVSVWDLLHSKYIPKGKRKELLRLYRSGILTTDQMETVVTTIVNKMEEEKAKEASHAQAGHWEGTTTPHTRIPKKDTSVRAEQEGDGDDDDDEEEEKEAEEQEEEAVVLGEKQEEALKSRMVNVAAGKFHGQRVSVWDLLHSKYIPKGKRKELLRLYRSGILTTDQMETVVTTIVNKMEEEKAKEASHAQAGHWEGTTTPHTRIPKKDTSVRAEQEGDGDDDDEEEEEEEKEADEQEEEAVVLGEKQEEALKSRMVNVAAGKFHGQRVSVWDLLHSKYIPKGKRKELLRLYRSGILTTDQMETVVTTIVNKMEEDKVTELSHVNCPVQEMGPSGKCQPSFLPEFLSVEETLRSETFIVPTGALQGQKVSCWELLSSNYVPEEKKQELLSQFEAGALSPQELAGLLTNSLTEAERPESSPSGSRGDGCLAEGKQAETSEDSHAQQLRLKKSLRTTMVPVAVGEYKGQKVCVLDLLFSKYVPQDKRQELLELYRAGTLPIQAMVATLVSMIEEAERKGGKSAKKKKKSCMKGALCWKDRGDHP
nr:epiplakin-like [Pogona vitticeps]